MEPAANATAPLPPTPPVVMELGMESVVPVCMVTAPLPGRAPEPRDTVTVSFAVNPPVKLSNAQVYAFVPQPAAESATARVTAASDTPVIFPETVIVRGVVPSNASVVLNVNGQM